MHSFTQLHTFLNYIHFELVPTWRKIFPSVNLYRQSYVLRPWEVCAHLVMSLFLTTQQRKASDFDSLTSFYTASLQMTENYGPSVLLMSIILIAEILSRSCFLFSTPHQITCLLTEVLFIKGKSFKMLLRYVPVCLASTTLSGRLLSLTNFQLQHKALFTFKGALSHELSS